MSQCEPRKQNFLRRKDWMEVRFMKFAALIADIDRNRKEPSLKSNLLEFLQSLVDTDGDL